MGKEYSQLLGEFLASLNGAAPSEREEGSFFDDPDHPICRSGEFHSSGGEDAMEAEASYQGTSGGSLTRRRISTARAIEIEPIIERRSWERYSFRTDE